jgi:signal transduction histidine kinase
MRLPRTLRGRIALSVGVAAAVVVVLLVAAFQVLLDRSLERSLEHALHEQADAALSGVAVRDGRVVLRDDAYEHVLGEVWIYDGRRALARPSGYRAADAQADALVGRTGVFADVDHTDLRLYARAVRDGGREIGTIVSGESRRAYQRTMRVAAVGSIVLGAGFLLVVVLLAREITRRALGPVSRMARTAADWTANDLDRRFGPTDRPDELGALARTFDGMLDRMAASLRNEQRLTAELSHELRTPLARIVAELDLLRRRERPRDERERAYAAIGRNAAEMHRILDTLMASARAEAGLDRGRSMLRPTLDRVADAWAPVLDARGARMEVRVGDEDLRVGVHESIVERAVAPLVDNASRFARSGVTIEAARVNGSVVLEVADDGPGILASEREAVFEPGRTGATANGHAGAGLGLTLSRRLARAAGGDVTVADIPDGGGARLRLELPAA